MSQTLKYKVRRMPTDAKYLSNKNLNDVVYGYLQSISYIGIVNDETIRFVYSKNINKSKIADQLRISRPSINKYFKKLTQYGFLREIKVMDNYGRLVNAIQLPETSKQFIPIKLDTLTFLLSASNANVIKIYTYLKMRYSYKKRNNNGHYQFTYLEISSVIGYSYQDKNNKQIQSILKALTLFGLIECEWNNAIGEKSLFKLIKVNDDVVANSSLVNPLAHSFEDSLPKANKDKK